MRVFIAVLVLIFGFQLWTKADDLSDFEIEGMSIGDSALNYVSKNKLLKNKKDWFISDEFSISADLGLNFLKIYDGLQLIYRTDDKKFKLEGIEAIKFYKNNIENCYSMFDEIVSDIKNMFKSADISSKETNSHPADKLGETKVTDIAIYMPNNDNIIVACYDWSKESGFGDQLRISLRTSEYAKFLSTAY